MIIFLGVENSVSKQQLFVGLRRENGQIGYLSESLSMPEFFELIRPCGESKALLIDFSPVIEALHLKHSQFEELSIREKYCSVFNYWQESKSYSNIQIRLPKYENLSMLSNELITSLQSRISKSRGNYSYRRVRPEDNFKAIRAIEKDTNIYIDVLLCFIHAKASLEIESFTKDVVLHQYCEYLKAIVTDLYFKVVEYSAWQEKYDLSDSSLLYKIAFENNNELRFYTELLPSFSTSVDLRLSLLCKSYSGQRYNDLNEREKFIDVKYRNPDYQELEGAKILRDLLLKINSISALIAKLKAGGVDWDPSEDNVEELKQLVSLE